MENQNKGLAVIPALAQLNNVQFSKDLAVAIKEGEVDPLMVNIFLKKVEAIQKSLKDDKEVLEVVNKEASKHILEGKTFDYMGAKLALAAVHTSYDFKTCGDPVWNSLNDVFEQVKELKEEREKFLKAAFPDKPNKFGFSAPKVIPEHVFGLERFDCGEEVTLSPPVKYQKTGLKITLPKK